jgi:CSLREA domain-containing protein
MVVARLFRSLLAAMLLLAAVPAFADFIVTTDSDADDGSDGACSLREAITAVNNQANYHECISANTGESYVSFAIPPNVGELHVIQVTSALPAIQHFIGLDATTQAGAVCTPVPNLRVQITDNVATTMPIHGLLLDSGSDFSSVSGLAISGFSPSGSAGILVAANDVAVGCMISGTNASGTTAAPNYYGIYVNGQSASIGIATDTLWLPNLFSGNTLANVFVDAGGADSVISGNYIGVDSSGAASLPTPYGVYALEVTGLHVGYAGGSGSIDRQRNVIGVASPPATTSVNVEFDHALDTVLAGNYIGVGADGQTAVAGGTGIGVNVFHSSGTLVGCDGNTPVADCRNVIASTAGVAIENFEGSDNTAIVNNFIGVASDGSTAFAGTAMTVGIELLGADALVARNVIMTGGVGTGVRLAPNSSNQTAVFLNQTNAGSNGVVMDSSGNCVQDNGAGVDVNDSSNPTVLSTDFLNNWWGAADGPAPTGSGNSAAGNVNYTPFLTAPSPYCNVDAETIFANGFE